MRSVRLVVACAFVAGAATSSLAQSMNGVSSRTPAKSEPFYTKDQATRGKFLFRRNCGVCHTIDPSVSTPQDIELPRPRSFGGMYLERKVFPGDPKWLFPSVYYLYKKAETMPPWDNQSISPQVRADIVSYILEANGYPTGGDELTPEYGPMKTMMLHEPGFTRLFNERDFSGIKFVFGYNCRAAPLGCGTTNPGTIFRVEHEMIVCKCQTHGVWYPEKKFRNFTLRFDYRFDRPPDWEGDDELYSASSGYFVFGNNVRVWPGGVEIEGNNRDILDIPGARKGTATYDFEAKRRAVKPLGEWNAVEIVSKDGEVKSYLNGVLLSTFTHQFKEPGLVAFQSQGGAIAWRNIRIRPE